MVTTNADSGAGSLREAIASACAGSTITFAADVTGTINLTSGQLEINKDLTILGPGAQVLTVRNTATPSATSRVLYVASGTVNITGLTFTGGNPNGTGFGCNGPTCGGGISNQGTLTLTQCVVSGNTASSGSSSSLGGGILNSGTLNLSSSTLSGNTAAGIESLGGGIYNDRGLVNVTNSTLSGNSASGGFEGQGGGIYTTVGTLNVMNSTLSGNFANSSSRENSGGGIYIDSGTVTLTNSTIAGNLINSNAGQHFGGGVFGTFTARNTLIAGNTVSGGSSNQGPDVFGTLNSQGYNLIGNNANATINATTGDQVGTSGSPLNPQLAPLAHYGGPTQTLRPQPGSPAIDAGNDCVTEAAHCSDANLTTLTTDQRGTGFNRKTGARVDIGAVEVNYALAATGGTPQSTTANTAFATALQATLTESGLPVSGVPLTFSAPGSGASAGFTGNPATTNASGQASVTATANLFPGSYSVTANTTPGLATAASFALSNACPLLTLAPTTLNGGTVGAAYSQQVSVSGAFGNSAAFTVSAGALPNGLTLSSAGLLSGTPTAPFNGNVTLKAQDSLGCMGTQTYALSIACNSLTVTPSVLSNAQANVAFSQQLSANGVAPLSFTLSANPTLPNWLALSAGGLLSGTPPASGSYSFTVNVRDENGCTGTASYTLLVGCPTVTLAALPNATAGTAYSANLSASPAGTYQFSSVNLPAWLTLAGNGALSGTPPAAGTVNFNVTVSSPVNCAQSIAVSLTVNCPTLRINPTTLPNANLGAAYTQTLTATPGSGHSFSLTTGALPNGLTLANNGTLSGTPTAAGTFSFTVTATAFGNCTGTRAYALTVTSTCSTITVNPTSLPGGALGAGYSQTITATGGSGPYTFSVVSGALPAGLTLDANSGVISGTPTAGGSFTPTIKAMANGCSGQRLYVISITCAAVTITPTTLPNAAPGVSYSQQLSANVAGTYSLLLGSLPAGLNLSSTGLLSGTTTQAGSYNLTVKLTAGNCSGTRAYTLVVGSGMTAALAMQGDYDGDGKADLALWSASGGAWRIARSSDQQLFTPQWGTAGDVSLLGDYAGDGKTDLAVFRPGNGTWYVKHSSDGSVLTKAWGAGYAPYFDVPVPGDYDGDGKTDIAVWRGADSNWYIVRSSDGMIETTAWGASYAPYFDVAVPGDYDGDGKTDLAVFRRSTGTWFVKRSSDGQVTVKAWGLGSDVPVAADYDGDGKTDIAVWRSGTWYIWQSASNNARATEWGANSAPYFDQAALGDYDGDGKADIAVWRAADQTWYIRCSADNSVLTRAAGQAGDTPVARR